MDLLNRYSQKTADYLSTVINDVGTGDELDFSRQFIIIMFHSDTTDIDGSLSYCRKMLSAVNRIEGQKVIFWNNIDSGGEFISKLFRVTVSDFWTEPVRYIRQISPEDFGLLLSRAFCIVGNSSAGIRESSFLGTPSVNIGNRQYGREKGNNVITVLDNTEDAIFQAIRKQMYQQYKPSKLYGNGNAGERIANTISTFTG